MAHILAIDIGATTVKFGVVNAEDHRDFRSFPSLPTLVQDPGPRLVARIAESVQSILAQCPVHDIVGVGVGCPGLIDNVRGVVVKAFNLPTLTGLPLAPQLAAHLGGRLPVALQNDANAVALGEFHYGDNRGCPNMVLLTLGTGIGGGVICDGKLLVGNDNAATELGHVKVEYVNPAPCGCGKPGCLEAYAGIEGIRRIARTVLAATPSPLSELGELTTEAITSAAEKQDPAAIEVLHRAGIYLGRAIAGFIDIFNPRKVVLAGGASPATPFLRPGIEQSLDQWCTIDYSRQRCAIEASALPKAINLLGAAAVYLESVRR